MSTLPVAAAGLLEDHPRYVGPVGDGVDPLFALLVGADQHGVVDLPVDPVGDHRGGGDVFGRDLVDVGQGGVPVQVRVDGRQPVDLIRDHVGDIPGGDGFALPEPCVLADVHQIGGDEADLGGAQLAEVLGEEQKRGDLRVRPVERADEDHGAAVDLPIDPEIRLAVGELAGLEEAAVGLQMLAEVVGERGVVGQGEEGTATAGARGTSGPGFSAFIFLFCPSGVDASQQPKLQFFCRFPA
jgi:hypothetical protein